MPRCALVTGCSAGGIGSALVEELHAQGLRVYATARSPAKMNHLVKLPNVTLVTLDVVDPASIAAAVDTVRQDLSSSGDSLDVLINNAGQSLVYPALDTSIDEAKRLFDVNFWGVIAVTQAFTPLLQAAKNGGTLVNVCSISGFLYAPWMSVYNASKAALMSWSETLRLELQPFNIRVISLKALSDIQLRGVGKDVSSKSAPADFAREVVKDVLAGASGPVWRGAMASIVKFMSNYMPTTVLDRAMSRGTGLDKLP
ncbi:uncharacterized protein ATNIH1004_001818 [Aspergillus tanneri]|uniref:Uncharacterized protein n=1 Tax=Aspergillus tanneri TaxID=1220188 RepID=A0A5M9N726_9EURO|nr:uncharacterized protein ATNIH1004_001818 [Aspergillus tanneri]KAA8652909.1 hypothetical protein ATNIH1004_001818 [Aspergillus tanneri]